MRDDVRDDVKGTRKDNPAHVDPDADAADIAYQDRADATRDAGADRELLAALANFVSIMGASCYAAFELGCDRPELAPEVERARDAALAEAFGRVARIARSDLKA